MEGLAYIGKGIALAGLYLGAAWFLVYHPEHIEYVGGAIGTGTLVILFFF